MELRYNKPCNRCVAIAVAPNSGRADPLLEPLRTLRQFRLLDPTTSEAESRRRKAIGESPLFAVNHSLSNANAAGTVRVGDAVYAQIKL